MDVHGVLDLVQRTAHKPVVRGTLPRAECSFLDRDLTPWGILVEMDRLLLEKGIVLMESGPDYILAASVSPIEFGESARPPAARISRPVIRPPAERGREGP